LIDGDSINKYLMYFYGMANNMDQNTEIGPASSPLIEQCIQKMRNVNPFPLDIGFISTRQKGNRPL